ncbi:DUF4123 domain-containing protein [Geomonas ferrireducens]|uniref:DUF4123 domain-containing protein n=1 Tax=Geomonas ferrireducens TaxID=2570227 RepID=UPI0013A5BED3|nr:DUF4123 domain-containing protein [Geomonas ferrireducens]
MISAADVKTFKRLLLCMEGARAFALLDGAAQPDLLATLTHYQPEHYCLLRGQLAPDLAAVAPYLVTLEPEAPFTDWVMSLWGLSSGVLGVSRRDLHWLNRHFRSLILIEHADRQAYFRYYDPVVLRNYLPTCTEVELRAFFGDVEFFIVEDEEPGVALIYGFDGEVLRQHMVALGGGAQLDILHGLAERNRLRPQGKAGKLNVRPEQLQQLGMSIYLERMRLYLNEVFPESRKVPRANLERMIMELTERAAGYKLVLENHVAAFLAAAWILGMKFDESYPAAREVLLDYEMDCGRKAEWLWDFIDATAASLGTGDGGREL